jgi:hypothetical protein
VVLQALDGVTLVAGNPLLFLLEGSPQNDYGLYTVTRIGVASVSPWVLTRDGNYTTSVTGAANNGAGLIRLAVTSTLSMVSGQNVTVSGVITGTTEANGTWAITIIDSTHVDLISSAFVHAWVSGGIVAYTVGSGTSPVAGQEVYVSNEGTVNFNTVWQLATSNPITNGSTAQLWARVWPEVNWVQLQSLTLVGGRYPANLYDKNMQVLAGARANVYAVDNAPSPFVPVLYQFYLGTRAYDAYISGQWYPIYQIANDSIKFVTYTAGPVVSNVTFDGTTCTLTVTTVTLSASLPQGSSILFS